MNEQLNIDPTIQEILDIYSQFNAPPYHTVTPHAARNLPTLKNAQEQMMADNIINRAVFLLKPNPEPVGSINYILINGRDSDILARVYTPKGEGPFPVVVYFHGGGWVLSNLDEYDASCRSICNTTECIVVSVAYRKAPEHKFPAAVNDAYDAVQWIITNADKINANPEQVAVAGEGAGANLATVCCLKIKKEGGIMPVAQLLICPITNWESNTESYAAFNQVSPIKKETTSWFWQQYLDSEKEGENVYASPLKETDLSGLPSAFIMTAEYDVLRDEGEQYAVSLYKAGVELEFNRYEGMIHDFFGLAGVVDTAEEAVEDATIFLLKAFKKEEATEDENVAEEKPHANT